jgi:phosphoserine phosphatase RsbU/P
MRAMHAPPESPAPAAWSDTNPDAGFSLLIVDDDEANRESIARRLQRRGFQVVVAADGPAALAHVAGGAFDLVLLDVMMPGMSGLEVLRRLRETHDVSRLPVVMATARDQSEDIVRALELGANDYVTKPFDFPVVLARLRTQLQVRRSVEQVIELQRQLSQRNYELEAANAKLLEGAERTRRELETAAKVQNTFLPSAAPLVPGVQFAWEFRPCTELAGDSLNVFSLGPKRVGMYVLDVSGHGVAASLLAVAASRLLSVISGSDSPDCDDRRARDVRPAEAAERLNESFPWNPTTEQFLTLFYAVLDVPGRLLTYVSAGHPGAIHVTRAGGPCVLQGSGLPIGVGESYEQHILPIAPGDRLYLYSDGVTEAMDARDNFFGVERLVEIIREGATLDLRDSVAAVLRALDQWHGESPARDDISLLAMQCD